MYDGEEFLKTNSQAVDITKVPWRRLSCRAVDRVASKGQSEKELSPEYSQRSELLLALDGGRCNVSPDRAGEGDHLAWFDGGRPTTTPENQLQQTSTTRALTQDNCEFTTDEEWHL